MDKLKIAMVGGGRIAQIAHLPNWSAMDNVELVALCDIDKGKVGFLTDKFNIPRWYYVLDEMLNREKLDALHICTPNLHHFPMAYLALSKGVNVLVEKPIALNYNDAKTLDEIATKNKLTLMVGMHNRFRDDVSMLRNFLAQDELGDIFYIKTGWLQRWQKQETSSWHSEKKSSGGGVLIDIGIQLLDLALYIVNFPQLKRVKLYDYHLNPEINVEDAALAVIETATGQTITIEVSWKMHLEKDTVYTHVFGKRGAAKLNPLRIHREMHANLVNLSPLDQHSSVDMFKKAYSKELRHFVNVLNGDKENRSSASDALKVMKIIDALYESASRGEEVDISSL
jgi:predicted dehydrogenase